jgi:lipoate-protein ligase A
MSLEERLFIVDYEPKAPSLNLAINALWYEKVKNDNPGVVVRVYKHMPGVILGYRESMDDVNEGYCTQHGIEVVERKTGGSAVVVDPANVLCYTAFINASRETVDLTRWYKRLVFPLRDQLKTKGVRATVEGAYYIRIEEKDKKPPVIGHAAHIYKEQGKKIIQFDGIVHVTNLDVEQIERMLRLRELWVSNKHQYIVTSRDSYPVINGVAKENMPPFNKEGSRMLRDEREELKDIRSLSNMGLSEEAFVDCLYEAMGNALGVLKKEKPFHFDKEEIEKTKKKFQKRPDGYKCGLGHCFIDLLEPEPMEL